MTPEEEAGRRKLVFEQGRMLGAFWPTVDAVVYLLELRERELRQQRESLDYEARLDVDAEISRVAQVLADLRALRQGDL
jgi:hypothetical protein